MKDKKHLISVLLALFVTFLWSTSWVLIKTGLSDLPPITFAGLRYTLAAVILILYLFIRGKAHEILLIERKMWKKLILLALTMYFLTQGAQYLGLAYLPTVQVSLILNFTPVLVMIFASKYINESPTKNNFIGIIVFLIGVLIYFFPMDTSWGSFLGYVVMIVGLFSNSIATVLGRNINKSKTVSPLVITTISMGIGGVLLLLTGIISEPFPDLSMNHVYLIGWLAVVNTAFAFTLWNKSMQVLTSIETSIINNTMLIQIAILSWVVLKEEVTVKAVIAILIVTIGAFLVQYRRKNNKPSKVNISS